MVSKRRHRSSDNTDPNVHGKKQKKEAETGKETEVSSKNGMNPLAESAISSIPEPSPAHTLPQRTFKLFELHHHFGCDAHHFVFIQRESNTKALITFKRNLREEMAAHFSNIRSFSRAFTETDIKNIQTSCLEILLGFEGTNDHVTYGVVLGKIEVQPRGSVDECEWSFDTFGDSKTPDWQKGFKIKPNQDIDLVEDTFI